MKVRFAFIALLITGLRAGTAVSNREPCGKMFPPKYGCEAALLDESKIPFAQLFEHFGLSPANRHEAAVEYWRLRTKYPMSTWTTLDETTLTALEKIYEAVYRRTSPALGYGLNTWYNPMYLKKNELLLVEYQPNLFPEGIRKGLPPHQLLEPNRYLDLDHDQGWFFTRHKISEGLNTPEDILGIDFLSGESTLFDNILYHLEKVYETYLIRGIVKPEDVARYRDTDATIDYTRNCFWVFADPQTHETRFVMRLMDASQGVNPVSPNRWVFMPSAVPIKLHLEVENPDVVLEERTLYGPKAILIELGRLVEDPSVEEGLPRAFGYVSRFLQKIHGLADGSFPKEMMIYAEATPAGKRLYQSKYGWEPVRKTAKGTWIMRMPPAKMLETYGKTLTLPSYSEH